MHNCPRINPRFMDIRMLQLKRGNIVSVKLMFEVLANGNRDDLRLRRAGRLPIAICALIAVCVITVLLFMPKKLSEPELVFLYFVNTIFTLSIFTFFSLNLKLLEVSKDVDRSLSDLIIRIIVVPLYMVISANVLLYNWKWLRWITVALMVVGGLLLQLLLIRLGILKLRYWNMGYTLLMFSVYIAFSRMMTWFLRKVVDTGGRVA